jgi:outer membrane cobalamin receptor
MAADVQINHTNRLYQFSGGIRAKAGKSSYLHTGFTMGGYTHFQYLLNDIADISKFMFSYDPETSTVANLFAEWGVSKTNQFQMSLRGDYFMYNMGSIPDVVHQPEYKIAALAKYNIYDKIILETNVNVIGGIMAIDTNTSSSIDLDAVFDLSLMGTYLLSDQFSIFAKFNNIFSQEYQLINRYPVRGFQAIGGISYTF